MKCDEFTSALDAYIDGELSPDDVRAMCEHAKGCAACGDELKRAEFLRDALRNMDADTFVPLEAQAAWRSAVKRERARKRKNTWIRSLTAVAAAAVVLVGSITLIGNQKNDLNTDSGMDGVMLGSAMESADTDQGTDDVMLKSAPAPVAAKESADTDSSTDDVMVGYIATSLDNGDSTETTTPLFKADSAEKAAAHMIASDGESAILTESAPNETDYACWKKIRVENLDSACNALEQLASEYEGSVTRENGVDQEITYRVELPGAYLDDFAAAVGGIGDVRDSETREGDFDPAIAYVLLYE